MRKHYEHIFEISHEINLFQKYKLPKFTTKEMENLNSSIIIKDMEIFQA